MHKKVKLSQLKPNPYRRLDRGYPIDQEKVEKLRESIRQTGFWGNILGRSDGNGKFEIAYGHHRYVALEKELGKNATVDLIVQPLSDADMLRIMARENMEEWASNAAVEHETIRAVVDAHADGSIDLGEYITETGVNERFKIPAGMIKRPKDPLPDEEEGMYTRLSVAVFLGWIRRTGKGGKETQPNAAFMQAWHALELIEGGYLTDAQFKGRSRKDMKAVVDAAVASKKAAEKEAHDWKMAQVRLKKAAEDGKVEPKKAQTAIAKAEKAEAEARKRAKVDAKQSAKAAAKAIDNGKDVKEAARAARSKQPKVKPMPPRIDDLADWVAEAISKLLVHQSENDLREKLNALIKFRGELKATKVAKLSNALYALSDRADFLREKLDA